MGSCVSSASPGTSTRPCETKGIIFFRTGVSLLGRGRHRGRGAALSQGDTRREVPHNTDGDGALAEALSEGDHKITYQENASSTPSNTIKQDHERARMTHICHM